jgi:adenylate cyclase
VGNSAPSLGDLGTTPVSKKESGGRSPTVMLHARTAATILDDTAIRYHGRGAALLLSALLTLAFALLFRFVPMQYSFLAAFLAMGGMLFVSRQLYVNGDFVPMLEAMISGGIFVAFASFGIYLEKDADRRFLYATFGKYVSPALIENMARDNIKPELGGEEVYGTAFFSDIESFSRLSEGMSPMDLITNLNEYFSTMTHVLIDNNGTLDKYIGDAIVAFFGAPRPSHHHAREACTAAVRMQEALARLREKWRSHTSKPEEVRNLKMRIGINSGHFVTGNMGCDLRMNYTMLGDTVNLASRLEGVGKEYGIYTVIGEDTYRVVKHDFLLRKVDTIRVKGRKEPGGIYQLMGMPREGDGPLRELIGTYQEALEVYRRGDFAEAKKLFEESLRLERFADAKNPSQVMIERTKKLIAIEPKEWDGVYTMQHK